MKYVGGKAKLAHEITTMINNNLEGKTGYMELFVGGCNILEMVNTNYKDKKYIINDSHYYLIELLKALKTGGLPSDEYTCNTHAQYKALELVGKELKPLIKTKTKHPTYSDAFIGFIGFCCAYSGKGFDGFARDNSQGNYFAMGLNGIKDLHKSLKNCVIENMDGLEVVDKYKPVNYLIYLDPPYANTIKYRHTTFDYDKFGNSVRELSKNNLVLVSEYNAPADFINVWDKTYIRNIKGDRVTPVEVTDNLYIHNSNLGKGTFYKQVNLFEVE